jgi:hypothetical protein
MIFPSESNSSLEEFLFRGPSGNQTDEAFDNKTFVLDNETELGINFIKFYNNITILFLYILMCLSFILNSISITCILWSKSYTPINILILNLSLSDILYASCVPMFVKQFTGDAVLQTESGCRISFFLDVTCMIVSHRLFFFIIY